MPKSSSSSEGVLGLGVTSPRAFYERFLRLGGIVVWSQEPPAAAAWVNPSARIALPARAVSAIVAALGTGPENSS